VIDELNKYRQQFDVTGMTPLISLTIGILSEIFDILPSSKFRLDCNGKLVRFFFSDFNLN